jgi:hypothetical protein
MNRHLLNYLAEARNARKRSIRRGRRTAKTVLRLQPLPNEKMRNTGQRRTQRLDDLSWQRKFAHINKTGVKNRYKDRNGNWKTEQGTRFTKSEARGLWGVLKKFDKTYPGRLNTLPFDQFAQVIYQFYRDNRKDFAPRGGLISGITRETGVQRQRADSAMDFRRDYNYSIDPDLGDREATGVDLLAWPASMRNRGARADRHVAARMKMADTLADEHDPSVKIGNKLWYVFAKPAPLKRSQTSKSKSGKRKYEVVIPPDFDIERKGFLDIKGLNFMKMDVARDLRGFWKGESALRVIHTSWSPDFEEFVAKMQDRAWNHEKGKLAYAMQKQMAKYALVYAQMQALSNQAGRSGDTKKLDDIKTKMDDYKDKLSQYLAFELPGMNKAEMANAWTWYLWLIAAENAYGVHLPERRTMRPTLAGSAQNPPRKVKVGKVDQTPIRIVREPGNKRYSPEIFSGLGYSQGSGEVRLTQGLKRFFSDPERGKRRVWMPITVSLREIGIDIAKLKRGDYLALSQAQKNIQVPARQVAGRINGELVVKKSAQFPMYAFSVGSSPYLLGLARADKYLQWFDSPVHPGKRLIHGREKLVSGPKSFKTPEELARHARPRDEITPGEQENLQKQMADSLQARRQLERRQKTAARDLARRIKEQQQRAARERLLQQRRKQRYGVDPARGELLAKGYSTGRQKFPVGRSHELRLQRERQERGEFVARRRRAHIDRVRANQAKLARSNRTSTEKGSPDVQKVGQGQKDYGLARQPDWAARDDREAKIRVQRSDARRRRRKTREESAMTPYTQWRTRWHSLMEVRGGF